MLLENPAWANFADNLYKSGCKTDDILCPKILSGAITGGWSSSIIQLTASIQELYMAVKSPDLTAEQRSYIIDTIIELHFSYYGYIRPQIKQLKSFNYAMMTKALND